MGDRDKKHMGPFVTGLLAVFCCTLWGSSFSAVKIGYQLFSIAPDDSGAQILFAGCRFALAGIMVIAVGSIRSREVLIPEKNEWRMIFILCLFQTAIQYFFFYIGMAHSSGVKGAIITGSNSFLSILTASLVFRQERLTWYKIAGCLLGFAGVMAANFNGGGIDTEFRLEGEGFVFLAAVSYAFSSALIKIYSMRANPVLLSGWQFAMGGILLVFTGILMGGRLPEIHVAAGAVLIYLAFLSAAAYTIWGILLKYNPVSRVSIYGFTNPVVGVLLSAALLGEGGQAFSVKNLCALALVSGGIYIVNRFHNEKESCPGNEG